MAHPLSGKSCEPTLRTHMPRHVLASLLLLCTEALWASDVTRVATANALMSRAKELAEQHKYVEAAQTAKEAVDLAAELRDKRERGAALFNLAWVFREMRDVTKAEALYKEALVTFRSSRGPRHPDTARALLALGNLYVELGDFLKAEPLLEDALGITRNVFGSKHARFVDAANKVAHLYCEKGDYARAERLLKEAVVIGREGLTNEDADLLVTSLALMVDIYRSMREYVNAERVASLISDIVRKRDGESVRYFTALSNQAVLYSDMGHHKEAATLLRRVLEVREKLLGKDDPTYANALSNLGSMCLRMGDFSEAEDLLREALLARRRKRGNSHPLTAESLANLAACYTSLGKYSQAEPLLKEAADIERKARGRTHPDHCWLLGELASLYVALGKPDMARETFNQQLAGLHARACVMLPDVSQERQMNLMVDAWRALDRYFSFLRRHLGTTDLAVEGAEWLARWKGLTVEIQQLEQQAMLMAAGADTGRLIGQLRTMRAQLARLTLKPPLHMQSMDIEDESSDIRARIAALEGEFRATKTPRRGTLQDARTITSSRIGASLPPGSVLVDFVQYQDYEARELNGKSGWGEYRYLAFVTQSPIRQNGKNRGVTVKAIDIGPSRSIDDAVREVRHAISLAGNSGEKEVCEKLEALSRRVLDPLRPLTEGSSHWIVCPAGQLWLLPFECFLAEDGSYMIEKAKVSYVGAGREVVRLATRGKAISGARTALIVGDPDFELSMEDQPAESGTSGLAEMGRVTRAPSPAEILKGVRFPPLPGTRAEVEYAAKMLGGRPVVGKHALEGLVKQASSPSVLYMATHGFFIPDHRQLRTPEASSRGLRVVSEVEAATAFDRPGVAWPFGRGRAPLVRCGLALAGANRRGSVTCRDGGEDGILTALEVLSLDLRGTEMVVLSACETGIGDIAQGEGVLGLRRAFLVAGARRVVTTLWKVSDRHTEQLMQDFVSQCHAGAHAVAALRDAQLTMIERLRRRTGGAHPYFWAAFTATGDWH